MDTEQLLCVWCSLQATDSAISSFKVYWWLLANEDTCCQLNLDMQVSGNIISFLDVFTPHYVNNNKNEL